MEIDLEAFPEILKWNKYSGTLRKIVGQTEKSLNSIQEQGLTSENEGLPCSKDFDSINALLGKVCCFCVVGPSSYENACLVNRLLNSQVLPCYEINAVPTAAWRPLKFKFSEKTSVSLVLPGGFELLRPSQSPYEEEVEPIILLKDLMYGKSPEDKEDAAILEIGLNHPILKRISILVGTLHTSSLPIFIENFINTLPVVLLNHVTYTPTDTVINSSEDEGFTDLFLPLLSISCELLEEPSVVTQLNNALKTLFLNHPLSKLKTSDPMMPLLRPDIKIIRKEDDVTNVAYSFLGKCLKYWQVSSLSLLIKVQKDLLKNLTLSAFDMAREIEITPKRINYVKNHEKQLYMSLITESTTKQNDIKNLVADTVSSLREPILQHVEELDLASLEWSGQSTNSSFRACNDEVQEIVLKMLNSAVAEKLTGYFDYMRETFTGTLQRCVESLEKDFRDDGVTNQAGDALKQLLSAAYQIEISLKTSSSFLQSLFEKLKIILRSASWKPDSSNAKEWRLKIAGETFDSLSDNKLAKSICLQFREKLKSSHETFIASLKMLESYHSGRLERTEEQRVKMKKVITPRLARHYLETTSLRDMIVYGMPKLGSEIGRGQYGVVFACSSWGGKAPCALKSVVPPDEKHWDDLSMEFYYTRSVPQHDCIVTSIGSVIDYSYGGGSSPAALLIMERMSRDLYSAIKMGLDWPSRLRVSLDVVRGIRFLHSQALVHRDIKLKNVLLDESNHGKLTDLGFCKPEAMMSGSIVGTPIHMAPEVFSGNYDNSVDVYAFGILFWYVCAGHVRLPYVFEQCQNKDQLWTSVKKGARPEKLVKFENDCWSLMEECWSGDPGKRPLLGDIEERLKLILAKAQSSPVSSVPHSCQIRNESVCVMNGL